MMRRLLTCIVLMAAVPQLAFAQVKDPVSAGFVAIRELRIEDAARELASVPAALRRTPESRYLASMVAFY